MVVTNKTSRANLNKAASEKVSAAKKTETDKSKQAIAVQRSALAQKTLEAAKKQVMISKKVAEAATKRIMKLYKQSASGKKARAEIAAKKAEQLKDFKWKP